MPLNKETKLNCGAVMDNGYSQRILDLMYKSQILDKAVCI